jgi:peptidoglycan/xylan/chitin deacetylase (PgdA/CDA1 family)
MLNLLRKFVINIDIQSAKIQLKYFEHKNNLTVLYFHQILPPSYEKKHSYFYTPQHTTIEDFETLTYDFVRNDYQFIDPEKITDILLNKGRYVLYTFDDGYFNNSLTVPILNRYKAHTIFFISSEHIIKGKRYWWDSLYHLYKSKIITYSDYMNKKRYFKTIKSDEVDDILLNSYGNEIIKPENDYDRPFTPSELLTFSKMPYVHIGNHTRNHSILTNYTIGEAKYEINKCQNDIKNLVGYFPKYISFPNGRLSPDIVEICKKEKFICSFTTRRKKNYVDEGTNSFLINRIIYDNLCNSKINSYRYLANHSLYNQIVNIIDK